jgi:hypothetical protein
MIGSHGVPAGFMPPHFGGVEPGDSLRVSCSRDPAVKHLII